MFIPVHDDNALRYIRRPWVTFALIGLNLIAFAAQFTPLGSASIASFAVVPGELMRAGFALAGARGAGDVWPVPEPLTLVTYAFMHNDPLHLATNMLFLWVFGDNVEDALGHGRYVLFYVLCAIAAGLMHSFITRWPELPLIGASGAIAGIVAAYVLLHPHVRVWVLFLRVIPLKVTAAVALGTWIVIQFVMVLMRDASLTAWWAHIGGLLAGAALIVLMRRPGVTLLGRG